MMKKSFVSRPKRLGQRHGAYRGTLTLQSSSWHQSQIQYNHYAMPGEIVPLQEQLERKKLATITSTAAGEKEWGEECELVWDEYVEGAGGEGGDEG